MLQRSGEFSEYELAERIKVGPYISLYRKGNDSVVYVPYKDLPSGEIKYVKFAWLNEQWIYIDNSQNS